MAGYRQYRCATCQALDIALWRITRSASVSVLILFHQVLTFEEAVEHSMLQHYSLSVWQVINMISGDVRSLTLALAANMVRVEPTASVPVCSTQISQHSTTPPKKTWVRWRRGLLRLLEPRCLVPPVQPTTHIRGRHPEMLSRWRASHVTPHWPVPFFDPTPPHSRSRCCSSGNTLTQDRTGLCTLHPAFAVRRSPLPS